MQDPAITRKEPSSASDTFEIVPDAINYVGDWEPHIKAGDIGLKSGVDINSGAAVLVDRRWSLKTKQNPKTLSRILELFPEYASRYEIYLSMMGKKAISLQDFMKIMQERSE